MEKPELSPDFTMEDLWKLREYNSIRHYNMTFEEMKAELNESTQRFQQEIMDIRSGKTVVPHGPKCMKCFVKIKWNDGLWVSEATTLHGEPIGLTLESDSLDALVERVKMTVLETLESNFGYVGTVDISVQVNHMEHLQTNSYQPHTKFKE
ncbi:MAG: DUF1902 domain-containing protein [Firmicutes bacterium]|nr:DUF1902 domain-containing protein [Bacillota bacterium]